MTDKIKVTICVSGYRIVASKAALAILYAAYRAKLVSDCSLVRIGDNLAQWLARGVYVK